MWCIPRRHVKNALNNHLMIPCVYAESEPKQVKALKEITAAIYRPIPPPTEPSRPMRWSRSFVKDLKHAERLVARGAGVGSWMRNLAWTSKFRSYVQGHCPDDIRKRGVAVAASSTPVVLAFLASVEAANPRSTSKIAAAKRALNLIRALTEKGPVEEAVSVRLLSKAAGKAVSAPQGQSNAMPVVLVARVVARWCSSDVWWKRQTALMMLTALCTLARGADVRSCTRKGISWIRTDGTTYRGSEKPVKHCNDKHCKRPNCVRGFLLLLPFRKNRQSQPTWMPVVERTAVKMMAEHLEWLSAHECQSDKLFIARKIGRQNRETVFNPNMSPKSSMSSQSFRTILRQALVECCGLTEPQAAGYGTHSFRLAGMELLRQRGVPAELRQQMGDWMSPKVALRYLQLDATAQFDILEQI